jgi:hypothetical protein
MANQEVENKIREIKKLTSKDNSVAGGFSRTSLWFCSEDIKQQSVKDDMVFSVCYMATLNLKHK